MADPISLTSGLLTLVAFAFQSSKVLHDIVDSFRSSRRTVRELREELEALSVVLQSLEGVVASTDADLSALKLPLLRCGNACKEFEVVILKCTANSNGSRTSFRDWAKLQYMGADIDGFRNMLAGYKSTMIIALADANMRTSAVTVGFLKEYKELINNTTSDLQEHLQDIDEKLQAISTLQGVQVSDADPSERQQIQEERDSTQQCLEICAQVYAHIDQVQPMMENISTPADTFQQSARGDSDLSAREVTAETLKSCKDNLTDAATKLERHLQTMNNRLQSASLQPLSILSYQPADQKRFQEEINSIRQCLEICTQAATQAEHRTNFFEDVSMADDSNQVIVSTIGELISAKRITAGSRSMQLLGQMSDETVQQLSLSRNVSAFNANAEASREERREKGTQFADRYGTGFKLISPKPGGTSHPQRDNN